jgi:hypothetical protein
VRIDDDDRVRSRREIDVDLVADVRAFVAGRKDLDGNVRRHQGRLEFLFGRIAHSHIRQIGDVRNERPDDLAGRRDPKTPFGPNFAASTRPLGQPDRPPDLQERMPPFRAHFLNRSAEDPLQRRLRFRQDDLALHLFVPLHTPPYHAAQR